MSLIVSFILPSLAADRSRRSGVSSPFARSTYRYTPLLALAMVPNHLIHASFGKIIFSVCDLLIGYLLFVLFPSSPSSSPTSSTRWIAGLWLLNPLPLNISTRGSSEALLAAIVLLSLALLSSTRDLPRQAAPSPLTRSQMAGSVILGLAVHVKIYPIVFAPAVLGWLGRGQRTRLGRAGLCRAGIQFAIISGGAFAVITFGCWLV